MAKQTDSPSKPIKANQNIKDGEDLHRDNYEANCEAHLHDRGRCDSLHLLIIRKTGFPKSLSQSRPPGKTSLMTAVTRWSVCLGQGLGEKEWVMATAAQNRSDCPGRHS